MKHGEKLLFAKNKLKNVHDNFITSLILSVGMSDKKNEQYYRNCTFFVDKEDFKLFSPSTKDRNIPTPRDYYRFRLPDNKYFLNDKFNILNFLKGIVRLTITDSFEAVTWAYRKSQNRQIIEGEVKKQK